jgi:hypothetical protein
MSGIQKTGSCCNKNIPPAQLVVCSNNPMQSNQWVAYFFPMNPNVSKVAFQTQKRWDDKEHCKPLFPNVMGQCFTGPA